ncbi:hypothetical protein MtrunA17_Chr1g0150901 [Medicago truncatula]|uniref:Uncharacterized protein n=1 Tax=Medicago truncatula TaxID=3880 RepID=A0A396JK60_MEDTR|nr:hypothetical protein MtrunA17_Chr1g0150901 [Medicago truncatula]
MCLEFGLFLHFFSLMECGILIVRFCTVISGPEILEILFRSKPRSVKC